jgi:hypothetical protein
MKKQFGRNKLIFLLGAGASCDAGMLNSTQMINEIERKLDGEWSEYKALYNYVQSSHFHLERIKGVPTREIIFNIENLVALLDTIIKIAKKDLDVYPFVGSWEKELLFITGNNFDQAQQFKNRILKKLKDEWLSPADFRTSSAYYKKFKETGYTHPLKIFSLNYDLCVEQNVGHENENLERGFNDDRIWDYRLYDLNADSMKDFYFYKLHGSLDWLRNTEDRLTYVDVVQRVNPLEMEIIFGVQNKLQSYDPYLFYFYAFREACFDADLIVSSGYGFMDRHINDNFINAFRLDPNKRLLVNIYDTEAGADDKWKNCIADRLQIPEGHISVVNKKAVDFFSQDMHVDFFSSLFPDESDEAEVLPS